MSSSTDSEKQPPAAVAATAAISPVDNASSPAAAAAAAAPEKTVQPLDASKLQSKGVTRMEAIVRATKTNRTMLWIVGGSILLCAFATSLDFGTTRFYAIPASGYYKQHSTVLSTLTIVTNIIAAVSKPFIAKLSDVTSRPYMYLMTLILYVVGYIIVAASQSISAYVVGEVFVAIGYSGLGMMDDIIVADLTTLEWRGFLSSLLSTPFIINTWFSGKIVDALVSRGEWRWGYGMFAIIMPVAVGPAIICLLYLDRKARKLGVYGQTAADLLHRREKEGSGGEEVGHANEEATGAEAAALAGTVERKTWQETLKRGLIEIDAFGLLLLGFGWSLLLLPFSLKTYAHGGWQNPSMIAMIVVGGVILIGYVVYEVNWAPVPSAPRRLVFNRTFIVCVIVEMFYFISSSIQGVYWSSYVLIAKPWSYQNWVYYNNTATLALCVFSPIAGLIQRWTHRYKTMQICGLVVKVIGVGILLDGMQATTNTGALAMSSILIGGGGSFSAVASRVASQACVPHQDVATAISLLALWTAVGRAVGGAIVAVIWSSNMPGQLKAHLPARNATDANVARMFNNIQTISRIPYNDPVRQGAIVAYRNTLYYCLVPALVLAFIPLIAALFQSNFYLGKQQNATANIGTDGQSLSDEDMNPVLPKATTKREKFIRFWAGK